MRGDVFQAHGHQGVHVGLVCLMAHHRAHVALGVKVLGFRKTVVQKKRCTATFAGQQALGQAGDKGLGLGLDFGQVVMLAFDLTRRAQVGGPVRPGQLAFVQGHAALMPDALDARQQLDRHRVQHFVAHHHALHGFGQGVEPAHLLAKRGQGELLPCAQIA